MESTGTAFCTAVPSEGVLATWFCGEPWLWCDLGHRNVLKRERRWPFWSRLIRDHVRGTRSDCGFRPDTLLDCLDMVDGSVDGSLSGDTHPREAVLSDSPSDHADSIAETAVAAEDPHPGDASPSGLVLDCLDIVDGDLDGEPSADSRPRTPSFTAFPGGAAGPLPGQEFEVRGDGVAVTAYAADGKIVITDIRAIDADPDLEEAC